jgi:hypothetical protein
MKTAEAIEALKIGKRIKRMPSDPPVDLCDHLSLHGFESYFQLCHQDKVIRVTPDTACAGTVKWIVTLEEFEQGNNHSYLNFDLYEESA